MKAILRNYKKLDNYLEEIIFSGERCLVFKKKNFLDASYVEDRKEIFAMALIYQWFKVRCRDYLLEPNNKMYLRKVVQLSGDEPEWMQETFNEGADFYDFEEDLLSSSFNEVTTRIRDYFFYILELYLAKIIKNAKNNPKHKFELKPHFLLRIREYVSFESALKEVEAWEESLIASLVSQITPEVIKKAYEGTKEILKFDDGFYVVQLLNPEAMDIESEMMKHAGGAGAYDKPIVEGKIQIYSLREPGGEAWVSFEVRDKKVFQCRGKFDKLPLKRHVPYIQAFVEHMGFEPWYDIINMGLVKGLDGKFYNLYNLPDNFECDTLDLRGLDLYGIKPPKNLKCNKINLSETHGMPKILDLRYCGEIVARAHSFHEVEEMYFPIGKVVDWSGQKGLPKVMDFSKSLEVNLSKTDFAGVWKVLFPVGKKVLLSEAEHLPKVLDFSNSSYVDLSWCDLKGVEEIFFGASEYNLSKTKNLPKMLDFSKSLDIDLSYASLAEVAEIIFPVGKKVNLYKAEKLPEKIDLSKSGSVDLSYADFSRVEECLLPSGVGVNLKSAKFLPKKLDLTNCFKVDFESADFSRVEEIKFASKQSVYFSEKAKLPGVMDFSKSLDVDLVFCDLSSVKKMIFAKGQKINLSKSKNLPSELLFLPSCNVNLGGCNLRDIKITPPNGGRINFSRAINFSEVLDLSKCLDVDFSWCNLFGVKKIIFPIGGSVNLMYAENLPKVVDLSMCVEVDLSKADLSGVKELVLPEKEENIKVKGLFLVPDAKIKKRGLGFVKKNKEAQLYKNKPKIVSSVYKDVSNQGGFNFIKNLFSLLNFK